MVEDLEAPRHPHQPHSSAPTLVHPLPLSPECGEMGMGEMGLVVMEYMMGNTGGRRTPAREPRLWTKKSVLSVPGKLANQVFWRSNRDVFMEV